MKLAACHEKCVYVAENAITIGFEYKIQRENNI